MSLTLLNDEWLKIQLVTHAREAFDIGLEIDSLEFHAWQGEADLHGVTFDMEKENQGIHGEIESLHVELAIWPLLFRQVDVETLTVSKPRVTYILDLPSEPEQQATVDRVTEKIVAVIDNLLLRIIETLLESFRAKEGYDIRIGQLEVVDGELACTVTRPQVAPVHVLYENLNYTAADLQPGQESFGAWGYITHADIDADLRIGDTQTTLEHRFAALPRIMRITDLDLEQVDRLGSQNDAIVFKQGTLDLLYRDPWRLGLKSTHNSQTCLLEKNLEAEIPDLLFIPIQPSDCPPRGERRESCPPIHSGTRSCSSQR